MGRRCGTCGHPAVEHINRFLVEGQTFREILARFPELRRSSLHRHKTQHVSSLLSQAKAAADAAAGGDVLRSALAKLDSIEVEARRLARLAEKKGNLKVAADLLVGQAVRLVELASKLRGLLHPGAVNVAVGVAVGDVQQDVRRAATDLLGTLLAEAPPELRRGLADWLKERREQWLSAAMQQVRADRVRMGLVDREGAPDPPTPSRRPSADAEGPG